MPGEFRVFFSCGRKNGGEVIDLRELIFLNKFKQVFLLQNIQYFKISLAKNSTGVFYICGGDIFLSVDVPEALGEFRAKLTACANNKNSLLFRFHDKVGRNY